MEFRRISGHQSNVTHDPAPPSAMRRIRQLRAIFAPCFHFADGNWQSVSVAVRGISPHMICAVSPTTQLEVGILSAPPAPHRLLSPNYAPWYSRKARSPTVANMRHIRKQSPCYREYIAGRAGFKVYNGSPIPIASQMETPSCLGDKDGA